MQLISRIMREQAEPGVPLVESVPDEQPVDPVRFTGTLFRILDEGYGFIKCDGGGKDHFVRVGSMRNRDEWEIAREMVEKKGGARVTFCSAPPKVKNQSARALDVVLICRYAGSTPESEG